MKLHETDLYDRLTRIYEFIESNPGTSQYVIATSLRISPGVIYNSLPMLESRGFLLYEDQGGSLYASKNLNTSNFLGNL